MIKSDFSHSESLVKKTPFLSKTRPNSSIFNKIGRFSIPFIVFGFIGFSTLLAKKIDFPPSTSMLKFKQIGEAVTIQSPKYELAFQSSKVVIETDRKTTSKLDFIDASETKPKLLVKSRKGKQEVLYKELYKDTDLYFYDKGNGNAAYDFVLAPHADVGAIRMDIVESSPLYLTEQGILVIPTPNGEIRHTAPYTYQKINGDTVEVESRFLLADNGVGFEVGTYDPAYELVIDPEITNTETMTNPPCVLTVSTSQPSVCAEGSTTITANASDGDGLYSYLWAVPSGASDPGDVSSFSSSIPGTYAVTVTDGNGCTGNNQGAFTTHPLPNVSITNYSVDGESSITTTANVSNGDGLYNYAWSVPIGASNPGDVSSFSSSTVGTYTVTVTDGNGCINTADCTNSTLTVNTSACQEATNTYSLTGAFTFSNAPPTGTLVIRVANEESQIFTPPFNSPQNFVFSNLNSDGESKELEAYFIDSGCVEIVNYTAPDVCVCDSDVCPSGETLGFEIQKDTIPYQTTNLNESFSIPKFDDMGGTRFLQKVLLSVGQSIRSSGVIESNDNASSEIGLKLVGSGTILLDGNTISITDLSFDSGEVTVPAGIPVPAQGSWAGDVIGSTLFGMGGIISTNLDNLTDPTTDPDWVTNVTGNPVHDDDLIYFPPIFADKTVNEVFTSNADLAEFIGAGNVDLVFDVQAGSSVFGSGNTQSLVNTRAQAVAFVKYVYCETISCPPLNCGRVIIERN